MVFGRRSEALAEQLRDQADRNQYLNKYWNDFHTAFNIGDKVYAPLWDKEGLVEEVCEDFILVSGLLPDREDDWVGFLQHWELEKR